MWLLDFPGRINWERTSYSYGVSSNKSLGSDVLTKESYLSFSVGIKDAYINSIEATGLSFLDDIKYAYLRSTKAVGIKKGFSVFKDKWLWNQLKKSYGKDIYSVNWTFV